MSTLHKDLFNLSQKTVRAKAFEGNKWGQRHYAAAFAPNRETGECVITLIHAAAHYADQHQARYESKIGDDGVLGPHWESIVRGIMGLLNGDCGRLDCGTLDKLLRDMLEAEGFDRDQ
jgi:hypothetical protein